MHTLCTHTRTHTHTCTYTHTHTHAHTHTHTHTHAHTGQLAIMDSDVSEKIPESMEVGMLGLVRKLIMLMPDNMVRRVVGQIVQHESLIAIANDHNIVVRTAVIRVSG